MPSHKQFTNPCLDKVEKLCLSYQLNSRIHVPFQTIFYNLDACDYRKQDTYHIIIPTISISKFSIKYLANFKRRLLNVILYALVTDLMHANSLHMDLVRDKLFSKVWDSILTYDKYDAEEYGFTWLGYTYYSSFDYVKQDDMESDIYYAGYDKGGRGRQYLTCMNISYRGNLSLGSMLYHLRRVQVQGSNS